MCAVLFRDPDPPLYPGGCDMKECRERGRYSIGNIYLCAECLILACEQGGVEVGTTAFRVSESLEYT